MSSGHHARGLFLLFFGRDVWHDALGMEAAAPNMRYKTVGPRFLAGLVVGSGKKNLPVLRYDREGERPWERYK